MIRKFETILKQHAKTMDAIPKRYEEEMKFNKANFAGQLLETKSQEARVRRDGDTYNAKENTRKQIKEVIAELCTKVSTMATKTDTEALATINTLKEMKLSKGEIQALVDKYHGDYMCMKLLCDIASNNNFYLKYTSIDDLQLAVKELEETAETFVSSYNRNETATYSQRLITVQESPFEDYQQLFDSSTVNITVKVRPSLTAEQKTTVMSLFEGHENDTEKRAEELTALNLDGKGLLSTYYEALASRE